jgi:hypothetical protein
VLTTLKPEPGRHRIRCLSAALALALSLGGIVSADPARAAAIDHFAHPRGLPPPARRSVAPHQPHLATNTIAVTSCADDGSPGTLRWAFAVAMSGDTVDASQLGCSTITLALGAVATSVDDIILVGPPSGYLTVDAGLQSRVFAHYGTGYIGLTDIEVENGRTEAGSSDFAAGGCIYSRGVVSLNHSQVKYCQAYGGATYGGAIFATAGVNLVYSTVSHGKAASQGYGAGGGNITTFGGLTAKYSSVYSGSASSQGSYGLNGGIWADGDVTLSHSTISGNTADIDGGASFSGASASGDLFIIESTISNNDSARSTYGSGLYIGHSATLANSTVSGNVERNAQNAKYGAGVFVRPGATLTMQSTAVGDNEFFDSVSGSYLPSDMGSNATNVQVLGANNLVYTATHYLQLPGDTLRAEPMLGPLQNNGGPTTTQMPQPGSPLIDAGNANANPGACDQRGAGYARVLGGRADIGAVETGGNVADRIFADGFDPGMCEG